MDVYSESIKAFCLFGIIALAFISYREGKEKQRLQKELDEKTKECDFWAQRLEDYLTKK